MTTSPPPTPAGFPKCPSCPLLETATPRICARCVASTIPERPWSCEVCARKLASSKESCGNPICNWDDRAFGRVFAICPKSGAVDVLLKKFKYEERFVGWSVIFGRLVLGWLQEHLDAGDYDLILGNPTAASRPIHHTEAILAAAQREDLEESWPIRPAGLLKASDTSQSGVKGTNWHTKWNAAVELESVVTLAAEIDVAGARILLFDDITTTCAQLQVLGRMLRRRGASHVDGLVIARTGG